MKSIRIISLLLLFTMTTAITSCGPLAKTTTSPSNVKLTAVDLMSSIKQKPVIISTNASDNNAAAIDFAIRLFQRCLSTTENTSISPTSVLCALAMTANGAKADTLSQMEDVLGLSVSELNEYFYAYIKSLPSDEKCSMNFANSIWIKDDDNYTIEDIFLQTNADYYGASIYKAAFDSNTLTDMNNWVNTHTDGMVPKIIDKLDDYAVIYLINALAFDGEWLEIYKENMINPGIFTCWSGERRKAEMMHSDEHAYLDDGNATGFIKAYAGGRFAFVALLPNEGLSIEDYVSTLSGQSLTYTLQHKQIEKVKTAIPKFESEYSHDMKDILKEMGMLYAFDENNADFTKLGHSRQGSFFINRVLHKTFISVDERGTRAGAATIVEMAETAIVDKSKTVYLDRPFVYMLIDQRTNLPFFIGTVLEV
ncbi:MAG: serpin family protein [Oscillospiraceae bacterium]|nr:serpin family protein [Oscillospiraceae bacterium]